MTGVSAISNAGLIDMKVIEMPARVPSRAALGVNFLMVGAIKAPINRTIPSTNTHIRPAAHAASHDFVLSFMGSIIANTTKNMCGTLGPEGNAVTSLRPSRSASRRAIKA